MGIMKILGLDPGLMTGVSLIEYVEDSTLKVLESYEWTIKEFYDNINDLLDKSDIVVMENFLVTTATTKKTFYPQSLHLIGLMGYLCYHSGKKMVLQDPADREFSPQILMKELGLWHKGGKGHSVQSIRHVFYYLAMRDRKLAKLVLDTV